MKTAKEKAQYLHIKFFTDGDITMEQAKEMALIAVNEILEATVKYVAIREKVDYSKTGFDNIVHTVYDKYWKEVKKEIEKL